MRVATWGTGLFASDSAQDFLEDLAELEPDDRIRKLERDFSELLDDPSQLLRQTVFSEPLVAAAALVALSLPGGQRIMDREGSYVADEILDASLDRPAPHLAPTALRVLAIVTAPESLWNRAWRRPEDREEALSAIETAKEILESVRPR